MKNSKWIVAYHFLVQELHSAGQESEGFLRIQLPSKGLSPISGKGSGSFCFTLPSLYSHLYIPIYHLHKLDIDKVCQYNDSQIL